MQFYHDLITEKSFQFLQSLRGQFKFTLIGGWAVFFFTQALKSKDVDVIVDYDELSRLKEVYSVSKNERLKKYEIKQGEVDVDIYLPHYSDLGLPVERLADLTVERDGFTLPALEILFLLKLYAYRARRGSAKGKKDELDIFSLAFLSEFDWRQYQQWALDFNFLDYHHLFLGLLKNTARIPELKINEQKMAKQRKRILAKATIGKT